MYVCILCRNERIHTHRRTLAIFRMDIWTLFLLSADESWRYIGKRNRFTILLLIYTSLFWNKGFLVNLKTAREKFFKICYVYGKRKTHKIQKYVWQVHCWSHSSDVIQISRKKWDIWSEAKICITSSKWDHFSRLFEIPSYQKPSY